MGGGDVLALIAGTGRLPAVLASAITSRGHRLVAITVEGDGTDLARLADVWYRVGIGEVRRMTELLASHGVRRVLVAGSVSRSRFVVEGDPEVRERLDRLADRGDQAMFQQVALHIFAQAGVEVGSPLEFVGGLLAGEGALARRAPTDREWDDIRRGMRLARAVAALDLGQTVVLKRGIVLAVEAAEGTDDAIRRGAGFADGVVIIKAARPHQDERFDLPTVGVNTIETMAASGAAVLAVEAGATLFVDRDEAIALADRHGIAIVGVPAA